MLPSWSDGKEKAVNVLNEISWMEEDLDGICETEIHLSLELKKALFNNGTKMLDSFQEKILSVLFEGKNSIIAQNDLNVFLSCFAAGLELIYTLEDRGMLIVSPTRENSISLCSSVSKIFSELKFKSATLIGGVPLNTQVDSHELTFRK